MVFVFFQSVLVDQNVIEVGSAKKGKVFFKEVVNTVLEGCGGIGPAEGHDSVFQVSIAWSESCLLYLDFRHSDLVVSLAEVQCCVPLDI